VMSLGFTETSIYGVQHMLTKCVTEFIHFDKKTSLNLVSIV